MLFRADDDDNEHAAFGLRLGWKPFWLSEAYGPPRFTFCGHGVEVRIGGPVFCLDEEIVEPGSARVGTGISSFFFRSRGLRRRGWRGEGGGEGRSKVVTLELEGVEREWVCGGLFDGVEVDAFGFALLMRRGGRGFFGGLEEMILIGRILVGWDELRGWMNWWVDGNVWFCWVVKTGSFGLWGQAIDQPKRWRLLIHIS